MNKAYYLGFITKVDKNLSFELPKDLRSYTRTHYKHISVPNSLTRVLPKHGNFDCHIPPRFCMISEKAPAKQPCKPSVSVRSAACILIPDSMNDDSWMNPDNDHASTTYDTCHPAMSNTSPWYRKHLYNDKSCS